MVHLSAEAGDGIQADWGRRGQEAGPRWGPKKVARTRASRRSEARRFIGPKRGRKVWDRGGAEQDAIPQLKLKVGTRQAVPRWPGQLDALGSRLGAGTL